jgi:Leucine-rich repeat (LRR) protein
VGCVEMDTPDWLVNPEQLQTSAIRIFLDAAGQILLLEIGSLRNLTSLSLGRNKLTNLPDSVGNLTNLTDLNLCNNQLSMLPDSIGKLTNLIELNLSNNELTWLYLPKNKLSKLPKYIGNLINLQYYNN